jgi:hypothetical protein
MARKGLLSTLAAMVGMGGAASSAAEATSALNARLDSFRAAAKEARRLFARPRRGSAKWRRNARREGVGSRRNFQGKAFRRRSLPLREWAAKNGAVPVCMMRRDRTLRMRNGQRYGVLESGMVVRLAVGQ